MAHVKWWEAAIARVTVGLPCLVLAACASLVTKAERRGGDTVTQWTLIGDYYGNGEANWRTLAVMQMAMHDALNAAHPVYGRWWPASASEPAADGANPEVAMAAAAVEVLMMLHPEREAETANAFASIMARYPDDASKAAGTRLGRAIGGAAVARRAQDGFGNVHFFPGADAPGRWRPTPSLFATSKTNDICPFLFASVDEVPTLPPPALDSPLYLQQLAETRSLGGLHSSQRTPAETSDAFFWAYQSSQRGFVNLAVRLLAGHPPRGGVHAEARVMAELAAALADSAIISWNGKAKYSFWRPITAIRADGADAWAPLIETPPFPEYPSGHATDCYVGAGVLQGAFPDLADPIVYLSSARLDPLDGLTTSTSSATYGMGQHAQSGQAEGVGGNERRFPTLAAAATDCASSRIWAGAHFLAAEIESKRLASIIVRRALSATSAAAASGGLASQ
jgi:membrane-associated phospholipid phosphatase